MVSNRYFSNPIHQESISCNAIILNTIPFSESDTIARVLTESLGKISLISKGAREQRARQKRSLELLDIGRIEIIASKGSLYKLKSFTSAIVLKNIRSDIDKINVASILCESYDNLTKEEQIVNASLYDSLVLALQAVDGADSKKEALKAAYIALNHLLLVSGYSREDLTQAASLKRLNATLDHIEYCSEKQLNSRKSLQMTLNTFSENE